MAPLNVRSLISKFEKLTTEIKGHEEREALKTPTTPKINARSFFPADNPNQPPVRKTTDAKMSTVEKNIRDVSDQIACIDEVSNDDFVKILFMLLNLLIDLGTIDIDGNYVIKARKDQCFKDIIRCKEELVKCLDDQFALESGIMNSKSTEVINDEEYDDLESADELEPKPITRAFSADEFTGLKSVTQMKSVFEENQRKPEPKINQSKSCSSLSSQYSEIAINNLPEEQSPLIDDAVLFAPSNSQNAINSYASNKSLYESKAVVEFKSVKQMKDIFEAGKKTEQTTSNTTLGKLARQLSDDEYETPTPKLLPMVPIEAPPSSPSRISNNAHTIQKQKDIMDTLWAEMEYYESLVANLDPSDVVRAEVLEENLVELYLEINKFNTSNDLDLNARKTQALAMADSIQNRINEKRTNLGMYISNLEDEPEDGSNELTDPELLQPLLEEVERYKDLISTFDPTETVKGQVLEENMCDVLLDVDKLNVAANEDLSKKKAKAIKDLGMLLNLLNEKRETYEEVNVKHVRQPKTEHNGVYDSKVQDKVKVFEEKGIKDAELQEQKINLEQKKQEQDELKLQANQKEQQEQELYREQAEQQEQKLKTYFPQNEAPLQSNVEYSYPLRQESLSISESQISEAFNDVYGLTEEEELRNERIFDLNGQLNDICVEINIINDIAESSDLDDEETDIFKRNIEEICAKLEKFDTCEDPDLDQGRRSALAFISDIQKKINERVVKLDKDKMEAVDIQAVESKLSDVTVTAIPMNPKSSQSSAASSLKDPNLSKYAQLLGVIEELGREVRPTYAGSRSSAERLKRGIVHARILVRECLIETERSARQ